MTGATPRILFFGMRCPFSVSVLAGLRAASFDVAAVVLPAPGAALPITLHWPPDPDRRLPVIGGGIDRIAAAAGIPVAEISSPSHRKVLGWLAARKPDLLAVACFPWKLPRQLRELPRVSALNIHPSLLPVGRGPDPLFWTFRHGMRQTGVTLHALAAGFDTGPILAQATVRVPDGIRERQLEADLAERGARLLIGKIPDLMAGTARVMEQDDEAATWAPLPRAQDFAIPTDLPARWAYNFVRGVAARCGPFRVLALATGEQITVRDALAWDERTTLSRSVVRDGETVTIQFQSGTVEFLVISEENSPPHLP